MTDSPPPTPDPVPTPPGGPETWAPPMAPFATSASAATPGRPPWVTRREVRAGLIVVGVLLVVGVLAGLVWLWWSPARGIALALGPHSLLPDETEAFVAADGRYAVIAVVLGVLAGVGTWFWRAVRGPLMAVALAVGCVAGASLTALVGWLFGGGVAGAATQKIVTPHLELRATGLIALQAAIALLVYGLSVTVSARDDLGVGDDPDEADPGDPEGLEGLDAAAARPVAGFDAPPRT